MALNHIGTVLSLSMLISLFEFMGLMEANQTSKLAVGHSSSPSLNSYYSISVFYGFFVPKRLCIGMHIL